MDAIYQLLASHRLRFGTERILQDNIAALLQSSGVDFHREHQLDGDAIDFLAGSVGIECKIDGGPSKVLEQLYRYAEFPEVQSLLLVTSRHTHRFNVAEMLGKPFRVLWIAGVI